MGLNGCQVSVFISVNRTLLTHFPDNISVCHGTCTEQKYGLSNYIMTVPEYIHLKKKKRRVFQNYYNSA